MGREKENPVLNCFLDKEEEKTFRWDAGEFRGLVNALNFNNKKMQKELTPQNSIGDLNMTSKDQDTELRLFTVWGYFGQSCVPIFCRY